MPRGFLAEAIEFLHDLSKPKHIEHGGKLIVHDESGWRELQPPFEPTVGTIRVSSLDAVVQLMASEANKALATTAVVRNATTVEVFSDAFGYHKQRHQPMIATAVTANYNWGIFLDHEKAMISVMTAFQDDGDRGELIRILSTLSTEDKIESDDTGTQTVVLKVSKVKHKEATVPFHFDMYPITTFTEVKQPKFPVICRFKRSDEGPKVALFRHEDQTWQLTAMQRIAMYLRRELLGAGAHDAMVLGPKHAADDPGPDPEGDRPF